jgi:hypothetical protein
MAPVRDEYERYRELKRQLAAADAANNEADAANNKADTATVKRSAAQ